MDRSADAAHPTLRSLALSVYLPTLLFAIGQGAVIPVVALSAADLGASVAFAGLVVAVRGVGVMVFDIPAGILIGRLGERRAMAIGTAVLVVSLLGALTSPSSVVFAFWTFAMGCSWAVWLLARLTYVSEVMPFHLRGRALSTLGGVNRIGNFIGPFTGAAAMVWLGLDGAYLVHIVLAVAGWVVLVAIPDPVSDTAAVGVPHASLPIRSIVREHSHVLLTAGVGAMMLSLLRASRHAVLPLWGAHIGLEPAAVSLVFGISAAMDMTLFYPAGLASDRFGRKAVAVPCLGILALGFMLIPFSRSFASLTAVALLIGLGNGIGSGIVMTLGADFAPPLQRAGFLGVWRVVSDLGQAGGPLVAGIVAGAASLGTASAVIGALGLLGATVFLVALPPPPEAR